METETPAASTAKTDDKKRRKGHIRGVYERMPGSGIWWICYFDASRRRRREKAGTWAAARDLYKRQRFTHAQTSVQHQRRGVPEWLWAGGQVLSLLIAAQNELSLAFSGKEAD